MTSVAVTAAIPSRVSSARAHSTLASIGTAFFSVVLIRTAWVSDSAYYTLRTVWHAADGLGWGWNAGDRVQAFDHPLWFLVLLAGRLLTGHTYLSALALSAAASLAAFWMVVRSSRAEPTVALAALVLGLSPLFVSFSTSGLESPLLHALLAALAVLALPDARMGQPPRLLTIALLAGAAALTQPATLWLTAPLLAVVSHGHRRARIAAAWSAILLPLACWLAFATWYYGTPGPNAWLADAAAHVEWRARATAGLAFVTESAREDPLLAAMIVCGLGAGFGADLRGRALAAGGMLYTGWLVLRGGSQMAGYGLTVTLVVALVLLCRALDMAGSRARLAALAGALALSAASPVRTFASDATYGATFRLTARVHDARAEDFQSTGLLLVNRTRTVPDHPDATQARELAASGARVAVAARRSGFFGMAAGPGLQVVDPSGRGDALLARLPPQVGRLWNWGAQRRIPDDYERAAIDRGRALGDPALAPLYEAIRVITRDPLTGWSRIAAARHLADGTDALIAASSFGPIRLALADVATDPAGPTSRDLNEGGALIALGSRRSVGALDVTLSRTFRYRVSLLDHSVTVATAVSDRAGWTLTGLGARQVRFPRSADATAIAISCLDGLGPCSLGSLQLAGN